MENTSDGMNTDQEITEIQDLIEFVVRSHSGQTRKSSDCPYVVHPIDVFSQVASWGITNVVMWKSSLCHDVREDCGITHEELVREIGQEAADIVEELSFFPKPDQPAPAQKALYINSFQSKSVDALVIKMADRICNTRDWVDGNNDYAEKYWLKATNLLQIMMDREEEIVDKLGVKVFSNMKHSTRMAHRLLEAFSKSN